MIEKRKFKGHGEKWTRKKELAIAALLSQPTMEDAAKAAGIGVATLWRWLKRSDFQTEYRDARHQAVSQATAQLQRACSTAVKTLEEVMACGGPNAAARVMAARTVLEMSLRSVEADDLAARLAEVERSVASKPVNLERVA